MTQIYTFELTTRNGLAASFDTVTVVNDPWGRAVANAGTNQSVLESVPSVQLDGSGSSTPSTGTLTYQWQQLSGPSATLSSLTAQKPTFVPPNLPFAGGPQDLVFQLTVNDGFGASEAATVTVTVTPVPEAPGAPTAVTAVGGDKKATVSFAPGYDGGSTILVYVVTCTPSNGGVKKSALRGSAVRHADGAHQRWALHVHGFCGQLGWDRVRFHFGSVLGVRAAGTADERDGDEQQHVGDGVVRARRNRRRSRSHLHRLVFVEQRWCDALRVLRWVAGGTDQLHCR